MRYETMTYQEADQIAYDFASVLEARSELILDARWLPHSKETIRRAFQYLIAHYESIRSTNRSRFMQEELGHALEQAKALILRVADFQTIDPQDQELVQAYNAGPRLKDLADRLGNDELDDTDRAIIDNYTRGGLALYSKYNGRSMTELGIN